MAVDGRVENATTFGSSELKYAVVTSTGESVVADLRDNEITVSVPAETIAEWAGSEQVGIEACQAGRGGELQILIEKDFACLKPRHGEDDADTFENPLAARNG